jgi:hypothetical protein
MKIKEHRIKAEWMVLARHYGMPGGVMDYGIAEIKGFFKSFKSADTYAKRLAKKTFEGFMQPIIWITKCEKTYKKDFILTSR